MTRGRAWSKKAEPAIEEMPSTKAVSKTALGAVSLSMRKAAGATKRKAPEDRLNLPKGTTSNHFMQSVVDTMDIMDQFPEMRGYHIVMDNAPIHVHNNVDPILICRGYTSVYLPPYSPKLNPIEQFWKDLKDYIKGDNFKGNEALTSRMMDACEKVSSRILTSVGTNFETDNLCNGPNECGIRGKRLAASSVGWWEGFRKGPKYSANIRVAGVVSIAVESAMCMTLHAGEATTVGFEELRKSEDLLRR
ncbi:hypothetical protein A0J61_00923 [Choanephora cucurbitarum]|uniref:Tc1-like transposase DDE domain-containing protein n=1 Tax=Choanephora cucurbitarum TaxID=101091 RepID=A0A1C7NPJ8_9FUNG|nr:hypothetical protein A0J61_00923 [Choanephora cucurbitarum]